jgi:putative membrane protein
LVSGTALFEVRELAHVRQLGYLAFGLSFAFLGIGIFNYFRIKKRLKKGNYLTM